MAASSPSQLILSTSASPTISISSTAGDSNERNSSDLSDYNVFIIALSVIQNEVTHDCRRVATLMLSGFLVVGILRK